MVKRTFIIPAETTFERLHETLQFVMGWEDSHLYEFVATYKDKMIRIVCDAEMMEDKKGQLAYYEHLLREGKELDRFDRKRFELLKKMIYKRAWSYKLPQVFQECQQIEYLYDFGDGWTHSVTLLEVIEDYPHPHPVLLDWEGACPPEDVGGPGGYAYFLEAWHDAKHEEHQEMRKWGEGLFKETVDLEHINWLMKEILRLKRVKK